MSSLLRIDQIHLENFRCFEDAELRFEEDTTVIFAENGGGKTALLAVLAIGLEPLLGPTSGSSSSTRWDQDIRRVRGRGGLREPAGDLRVEYQGSVSECALGWRFVASPREPTAHWEDEFLKTQASHLLSRDRRWPVIAWYGTQRVWPQAEKLPKWFEQRDHRWIGYEDCLDPRSDEGALLTWWREETFGDVQRAQRNAPSRQFARAVQVAIERATPHVQEVWYDITTDAVRVRYDDNHEAAWDELSDGYHAFIALVADIARRAVILNGEDGENAPALAEGIVLIDEIDLHLHPRWQRVVLGGLRAAFPKLQFIVTTHSPQVLSSALNRQVRRLVNGKFSTQEVHVQGRDTNAILRELFGTDDRGEEGAKTLRELYQLIDTGQLAAARAKVDELRARWGDLDPELIRVEGFLEEEP